MSMTHATTADAFTPENFGGLVNLAVQAKSIAAKSAMFSNDKHKVNFHFGLVVEQHADQQRERIGSEQRIRGRVLGKLQLRHRHLRVTVAVRDSLG
jgi:hypothetical protein